MRLHKEVRVIRDLRVTLIQVQQDQQVLHLQETVVTKDQRDQQGTMDLRVQKVIKEPKD